MWIFDRTLLDIALRASIIYVVILIGLRLTGKREVGQMTPFDLVLLLLIANAVQNAMTGPDTSVTGGLVAAGTLLLLNRAVGYIVWRNKKVRRVVEGTPTVLIRSGKAVERNLMRERITEEELRQTMREHGILDISEVYLAVLEIDGAVSVLKNDEVSLPVKPHRKIRLRT
ncbi:MAG: YetF domain-containing protein [Bacteroidota bacterium]